MFLKKKQLLALFVVLSAIIMITVYIPLSAGSQQNPQGQSPMAGAAPLSIPGLEDLTGMVQGTNLASLSMSKFTQDQNKVYFQVDKFAVGDQASKNAMVYSFSPGLPGIADSATGMVAVNVSTFSTSLQSADMMSASDVGAAMKPSQGSLLFNAMANPNAIGEMRSTFDMQQMAIITPDGKSTPINPTTPTMAVFDRPPMLVYLVVPTELYGVIIGVIPFGPIPPPPPPPGCPPDKPYPDPTHPGLCCANPGEHYDDLLGKCCPGGTHGIAGCTECCAEGQTCQDGVCTVTPTPCPSDKPVRNPDGTCCEKANQHQDPGAPYCCDIDTTWDATAKQCCSAGTHGIEGCTGCCKDGDVCQNGVCTATPCPPETPYEDPTHPGQCCANQGDHWEGSISSCCPPDQVGGDPGLKNCCPKDTPYYDPTTSGKCCANQGDHWDEFMQSCCPPGTEGSTDPDGAKGCYPVVQTTSTPTPIPPVTPPQPQCTLSCGWWQTLDPGACRCVDNPCPAGMVRDSSHQCVCPPGKCQDASGNCVTLNCKAGQHPDRSKCACIDDPCPQGKVRDSSGVCACPSGMCQDASGHCIKLTCKAGQHPDMSKCACVNDPCTGGQVRDSSGQCVCPSGACKDASGNCITLNCKAWQTKDTSSCRCVDQPCTQGKVRDSSGACVCPKGQDVDPDGYCINIVGTSKPSPTPKPLCPSGQHMSSGHCCPTGKEWDSVEGVCGGQSQKVSVTPSPQVSLKPSQSCPRNQHWDDSQKKCVAGQKVTATPIQCASGYHAENGKCMPNNRGVTCPAGQHIDTATGKCVTNTQTHTLTVSGVPRTIPRTRTMVARQHSGTAQGLIN